jgi:hypothetical protein
MYPPQERLLEELWAGQLISHTSTQRLAYILLQTLRDGSDPQQAGCSRSSKTEQEVLLPGVDDRGVWLQAHLDHMNIRRLCRDLEQQRRQQQQQQQADGGAAEGQAQEQQQQANRNR